MQKKIINKKKSYILAGFTILVWGTCAATGALLLDRLPMMTVLFFSGFFAALFLGIYSAATGKLRELKALSKKDFLVLLGLGALGMVLYNILYYFGITVLETQQACIINYLWPICTVVISGALYKEKMTVTKILALLVSFFGVAVVATGGSLSNLAHTNLWGVAACLLAAVCYGVFSALNIQVKCHKFPAMTVYYALLAVVGFVSMLVMGEPFPKLTVGEWAIMVWNGVFIFGIAYTTWAMAMDCGETAVISNLAYLTPFVSLVAIYFLLGEPIGLSSIVGLAIVILGVVIQLVGEGRGKESRNKKG